MFERRAMYNSEEMVAVTLQNQGQRKTRDVSVPSRCLAIKRKSEMTTAQRSLTKERVQALAILIFIMAIIFYSLFSSFSEATSKTHTQTHIHTCSKSHPYRSRVSKG